MFGEDTDFVTFTLQVTTSTTRQQTGHLALAQPFGRKLEKQRSRLNKLRTAFSQALEAKRAQLRILQVVRQLTSRTTPLRNRLPKTRYVCPDY